jgi:UDP-glucose:(heptosyl)LPS alpha-1,3-glucosyltransferase
VKVAIIKSNYTPYGGAEKYTHALIKAFLEAGHEVHLITSQGSRWNEALQGKGQYLSGDNFKIRHVWQFRYNNLLKLISFNASVKGHLKKETYDSILGMDNTEFQTHLRLGGGLHRAWLNRRSKDASALRRLTFQINPFHRKVVEIQEKALLAPALKRIICNSYLVKGELEYYYPQVAHKAIVVHNGVEWQEFGEAFEEGILRKDQILEELGLPLRKFYFLFAGSGYERKGLHYAIRAMKELPEEICLIVVGKDRNERRFRAMTERLSLGKRVFFMGPRKDIIRFYQVSDAFVLPTLYDPFSNATLEALAMGLFVVTSVANGAHEVIRRGAGSVIEDLSDISSIREAMEKALKPALSKREVRESVKELEFDRQLKRIVEVCTTLS